MSMLTFAIYTMYVNRLDLLKGGIASIAIYGAKLTVVDNSSGRELSEFGGVERVFHPPEPMYCCGSYNWIADDAVKRGLDVFFIMHSDALASPEIIEAMVSKAEELNGEGRRWGVMFSNYDVLVAHNTHVVGDMRWDPELPLYYTDVDYYYQWQVPGVRGQVLGKNQVAIG